VGESIVGNAALNGKTAIVTGASSGIGQATARRLVEDGAAVLIMGRREGPLAETRDGLLKEFPQARVEIFAGDALKEADVKAALARAHAMAGRLDILIPTVGGAMIKPLLLHDAESFRSEYDLNVMSVFYMVRNGVPLMERGGTIVCISTSTAVQQYLGLTAYVTAKAGLERFIRAAAYELGGAGIRINGVRSGMTRSASTEDMYQHPELVAHFDREIPLGRTGMPDDVARVVRFMAGPESAWVTGHTVPADGGQDMGKAPDMLDAIYGKDVIDQVRAGKSPAQPAS
jgi:NAD(P)-dependent dehydrogenase (short-subunit alcohol dehydrogenase family)